MSEQSENRIKKLLQNFPQEKAVGMSGLALLCGATIFALSGDPGAALLGGVGSNVLADQLKQHFERVRDLPDADERERLAAFARSLTPDIRHNEDLHRAVGAFVDSYRTFDVALALVQENPQVHGWLLTRIYSDIRAYRHDFDRIHEKLAQMMAQLEKLNRDEDDEALRPYLEMVARRSERLPLAPLHPAGGERVDISLGDVFVSLKVGDVAVLDSIEAEEKEWSGGSDAALAHIYAKQRLILLGDAGSGKSTLLRYLSYCLALAHLQPDKNWFSMLQWQVSYFDLEETFQRKRDEGAALLSSLTNRQRRQEPEPKTMQWQLPGLAPVLVELREFARTSFDPRSHHSLWNYVEKSLIDEDMVEAAAALRKKGQRGELLLLFDGVDEVANERRADVWQAIASLRKGPYGGCRWIATCRVLSFVPAEAPPGAAAQTIQPLAQEQIDLFIQKWTEALRERGELTTDEAGAFQTNLLEATRDRLRELAPNPMLLTIIVLVQKYHGTLPRERARLYDACVEIMLLRWQHHKEKAKDGKKLSILQQLGLEEGDLEKLLWEIAWQAHSKNPAASGPGDIAQSELFRVLQQPKYFGEKDLVRVSKFVQYTKDRAHLLIFKGSTTEPIYTFPHRTFQEFLAARYLLTNRSARRRIDKLAAMGPLWREVLHLAVGFLLYKLKDEEAAIELVEGILLDELPKDPTKADWHCIWLAGEMAAMIGVELLEVDEVGAEYLPRLQRQLAALLTAGALTPPQRAEAGTMLAALGEAREDVACGVPAMVHVPAGPFWMGSDKKKDREADDDETPQHQVTLPAYRIGKYPVTNAQFALFVQAGGYENDAYWTKAGWAQRKKQGWTGPRYSDNPRFNQANQPVVGVSWYEVAAYCNWLKATTGRAFRLPSEAMWEKAARGADGRIYPWGDEWDAARLNASETKINRPSAVGIFPHGKSPVEAYDMCGNVLEWCSTAWRSYPFQAEPYEEEVEGERDRCRRGGAFDLLRSCRAAFRGYVRPVSRYYAMGFRVAEHLSDPES